ncbi:class I SAM-dependent DNA methyltransferase [Pseudoroseomonas wenyumeiae]|uniref:site-specific DNA-methyltransferase (adenine-specific) n=1 Tax=Teichococcus wenyumeiae TaxID=2478470 RepID=A0A3A9JBJ1_9PROT|nr:DNA methyltransferase [Pseudoroseomonas wenyumeiae]RKK04667.1 class I SAM-dependent DNA methyltransferase [Pseudoroseomonas wenyumeiae]RMI17330.1 class I SAM-dependent DNA methyltransferase [Pseudoroseomonas wenyumeiae]
MNAVEIEQAVSALAEQSFDRSAFPYAFLAAFGNKDTTLKRLRSGASNKSDLGGVLQTNNIHIATCEPGAVTNTLHALKASPATGRAKAKFILATDGNSLEAEDLVSGDTVACAYRDFADHFGFFLALAGISTVKEIRESSFDIRATSRLNRLYVELLKDNPDWGSAARRPDMNHFMARLIFCFFAEDTDIFGGRGKFTETVARMSAGDSTNTHEVIATLFRVMNTKRENRAADGLPRWANTDNFPYVNGQLFSGGDEVPRFSKIARSYLLHVGSLDWTKINPDIFGSMIQAVAEDEERGELGMHYTSVPNILKVLNPLLLDELRAKLEEAGDNARMLLNLRKRIAKIRVFDPACGSGNFLVIAYKEMRAIEAEVNQRRGEPDRASEIPLTNFRGIELRDFSAEIARLALVIAEYQCDVLYRGQKLALAEFLPLRNENWITCGNALRLDWLSVCPPTGTGVKVQADDLFETPLDQAEIDFENEGGETYICGNPPYLGSRDQKEEQKADLRLLFDKRLSNWKSLDYVAGWFVKAADYSTKTRSIAAFVSTNSICQGLQVPVLWPEIFAAGCQIEFAYTSFRWANLASHNAGVTVAIIGITSDPRSTRRLFSLDDNGQTIERQCAHINAYLAVGESVIVEKASRPADSRGDMTFGNMPLDGGHLLLSREQLDGLQLTPAQERRFVRRIYGSAEFIRGLVRYCLWIKDEDLAEALGIPPIAQRIEDVRRMRRNGGATAKDLADRPHQFQRTITGKQSTLIVPRVSSETREYLPCGYEPGGSIASDAVCAMYDAPLWNMALIASRLHIVWVGAVCGKMKTDFRYSNTLGWNTFPIPTLTDKNKADLTRCAEDILLAREAHFPATVADLYNPDSMTADLRVAHDRNDEVLERIYIGRRFKNDTERLEKLFELYTKMMAGQGTARKKKKPEAVA